MCRGAGNCHFYYMNMSRQAEPVYLQIAAALKAELIHYAAGDMLPGELPLAKRFGVNRHTARRALDVLAQEGYVVRVQGKGTQVLEAPLRYPMVEHSAYSDWFGATGHSTKAKLLGVVRRDAEQVEAQHLGLETGTEVVEYRTLRLIQESPISVIRHVFALEHAELLAGYKQGSMRRYLRGQGQVLTRAFSLIGARMPTMQESSRLLMPENRPVLTVQTLSKNQDGRAFELAWSVSRADRFQYHIVV